MAFPTAVTFWAPIWLVTNQTPAQTQLASAEPIPGRSSERESPRRSWTLVSSTRRLIETIDVGGIGILWRPQCEVSLVGKVPAEELERIRGSDG